MDQLLGIFLILASGLILGKISFFGVKFGYAGVLMIGLVFGHFGFQVDSFITNIGLVLFVTGIGFTAGPVFVSNLKGKGMQYFSIAFGTIAAGTLLTVAVIKLVGLSEPLSLGVFTGALTSTPGLGAVVEATRSDLASVGYGIAYPFGVIGVILFVHLTLKMLKKNPKEEASNFNKDLKSVDRGLDTLKKIVIDKQGLFGYFLAIVLGILIGKISIPFINGSELSLGNAGGVLISGLAFGHFGRIGKLSLNFPRESAQLFSDLGLILFYIGTGVSAGAGALDILMEYGLVLFFAGAIITVVSALAGFIIGYYIFKLNIVDVLGAVTGAMTSTPGLGTVVDVTNEPNVAASYASTYPIALFFVVVFVQVLNSVL